MKIKDITKLHMIILCSILSIASCRKSNEFSSPEQTLQTLKRFALEDDIDNFVQGFYVINILKRSGISDTELLTWTQNEGMVWSLRQTSKPGVKELITSLLEVQRIFKECSFVILLQRDAGPNILECTIKTVPLSGSRYQKSTDDWIFVKYKNKWLVDLDAWVTVMQ